MPRACLCIQCEWGYDRGWKAKEYIRQQVSSSFSWRLTTTYSVHQKHAESLLLIALWPCRQAHANDCHARDSKAWCTGWQVKCTQTSLPRMRSRRCMHSLETFQTLFERSSGLNEQMEMRVGKQGTSSNVSNLQLLPSSVTSFHHLSPTKSLPATFLVCSQSSFRADAEGLFYYSQKS